MSQNTQDTLSIELEVKDGKAEVVLSRSKQKLDDFVQAAEKAQPNIKFKIDNRSFVDLDKLEKRANDTRHSFAQIAAARINSGNIGNLTKEIVTAHERARQLSNDIGNIKAELANPNRKSSIAFLTEELKAAETEAARLDKKLATIAPANAGDKKTGGRRGISETQRALLEVADDFVPAGFNRPFNAVAREVLAAANAKTALTAATTASTAATVASTAAQTAEGAAVATTTAAVEAETAAFAGLSLASLGIFAGVAAAGFLVVKVTESIREKAEHHLAVQTKITGELNKQRLEAKELSREFAEQRANAARSDNFARSVAIDSIEQLNRRKQNLEASIKQSETLREAAINTSGKEGKDSARVKAIDNDLANERRELLDVENRIRNLPFERNKRFDDSFGKHNEEFAKSQQNAIEFERKRAEAAAEAEKKRLADVEKAKEKVKELQRQYLATFDQLARRSTDNPFVSIFTEADKALRDLRQNIRGLPPELQKIAVEMQQKINLKQLFDAQLNNALSVFDLRNSAENFRNPFDGEKQKKDQQEFVKRFLANNPNYLYLQGKNSLDEETRSKILKQFAPSSLTETPADRLNKQLEDKYRLLYKPGQTSEQIARNDKAFIAATSGINPLDLNRSLRESAAFVRERDANRQEQYQKDALKYYDKQLKAQEAIVANTANQNKTAEKGGTKALEVIFKDKTSDGIEFQKSATPADTNSAYQDDTSFFSMLNPSAFNKTK